MTAATGMPKIAPDTPAIFEPMITEARTTIGCSPTASAISRGWRTFITMNQPTIMIAKVGRIRPGWVKIATMTGGAQATNGPKKGMAINSPDAAVVTAMKSRPSRALVARAIAA